MKMQIIKKTYLDDGYGGKVPIDNVVETIYGKVSPLSREVALRDYGRIVTRGQVVYLNYHIKTQGEIFLQIDGVIYEVIDKLESKRKGVYTCELKSR